MSVSTFLYLCLALRNIVWGLPHLVPEVLHNGTKITYNIMPLEKDGIINHDSGGAKGEGGNSPLKAYDISDDFIRGRHFLQDNDRDVSSKADLKAIPKSPYKNLEFPQNRFISKAPEFSPPTEANVKYPEEITGSNSTLTRAGVQKLLKNDTYFDETFDSPLEQEDRLRTVDNDSNFSAKPSGRNQDSETSIHGNFELSEKDNSSFVKGFEDEGVKLSRDQKVACHSSKSHILGCEIELFHVDQSLPFFYYGLEIFNSLLLDEVCPCPMPILDPKCPEQVQKIGRFMEAHCFSSTF